MRELLKNKKFMKLFLGNSISSMGDSMDNVVFMLLVISLTNSPKATGIMIAITGIPSFVLSVFGGTIADIMSRKKIMVVGAIINGCIVTVFMFLQIFNLLTFPLICLGLFLLECVSRFTGPASGATLPNLITRAEYLKGRAFISTVNLMISLMGPAISSLLVAVSGYWVPMALDGATYFLSGAIFQSIDLKEIEEKRERTERITLKEVWEKSKVGFTYMVGNSMVFKLVMLFLYMNIILGLLEIPLPFLMEENFDLRKEYFAGFKIVFTVGAFLAGVTVAKKKVDNMGKAIVLNMIIMGGALILFGQSHNVILGVIFSGTSAFCRAFIVILASSFLMFSIEDEFRGRVSGVMVLMVAALHPFATFTSGYLVDEIGAGNVYSLGGGLFILLAIKLLFDKKLMNHSMEEELDEVA